MKVYHMSDTLALGQALSPDYKGQMALAQPFAQALARSEDCFFGAAMAAKYLWASLGKFGMRDMQTDYVKWAVEGAFEYVRRRESPERPCRLRGNYFFDDLDACKELFELDWGRAPEEERRKIRLFEVELEDDAPARLDMRLFDEAYDAFDKDESDIQTVLDRARRYFTGEGSPRPVWELLSEKRAVAVADLTEYLHP